MCGRYSMYESMEYYLRQLSLDLVVINGYDDERINRYNVAPASRVEIIRPVAGGLSVDRAKWGWSPDWSTGKRFDPINARGEAVATSTFFRALWPAGRALAPANGWFEWVADPQNAKRKQPVHITSATGEPLFFAALAQVRLVANERDGFVILTAEADGGLREIHGRKPVVLGAELAREWLAPELSSGRAEQIVREGGLRAEAFRWYPVDKAVGNVRNEGAGLIESESCKSKFTGE